MIPEIISSIKNIKVISASIDLALRNHNAKYPKSEVSIYNKKLQKELKGLKKLLYIIDYEVDREVKKFEKKK
jgi:hypothetical protein